MCNITFNGLCGGSDCRYEISVRPKTIRAPVVVLEVGKLGFNISSGVGFYEANHATNCLLWWYGNKEMNMVFVMICLLNIDGWIVFSDFE